MTKRSLSKKFAPKSNNKAQETKTMNVAVDDIVVRVEDILDAKRIARMLKVFCPNSENAACVSGEYKEEILRNLQKANYETLKIFQEYLCASFGGDLEGMSIYEILDSDRYYLDCLAELSIKELHARSYRDLVEDRSMMEAHQDFCTDLTINYGRRFWNAQGGAMKREKFLELLNKKNPIMGRYYSNLPEFNKARFVCFIMDGDGKMRFFVHSTTGWHRVIDDEGVWIAA